VLGTPCVPSGCGRRPACPYPRTLEDRFQGADPATGLLDTQTAAAQQRDARRVIAAVFEPLEALDQDRLGRLLSQIRHNAAHSTFLNYASDLRTVLFHRQNPLPAPQKMIPDPHKGGRSYIIIGHWTASYQAIGTLGLTDLAGPKYTLAMIIVIDYNVGNVQSVCNALQHIGCAAELSRDPARIEKAAGLVLPGVAAFGYAKEALGSAAALVQQAVAAGKPILGICVGHQLLFDESCEYGPHEGLGLVQGAAVPIPPTQTVPHMGWNLVELPGDMDLFADLDRRSTSTSPIPSTSR